jgi:hypothetical protein
MGAQPWNGWDSRYHPIPLFLSSPAPSPNQQCLGKEKWDGDVERRPSGEIFFSFIADQKGELGELAEANIAHTKSTQKGRKGEKEAVGKWNKMDVGGERPSPRRSNLAKEEGANRRKQLFALKSGRANQKFFFLLPSFHRNTKSAKNGGIAQTSCVKWLAHKIPYHIHSSHPFIHSFIRQTKLCSISAKQYF